MSTAESNAARFTRYDLVAGLAVFAMALGVYIATLAPSVTLEDSGELIVGAAMFGVPHPPGYPMWSLSGFLLANVIPIGSYAWRINLLSAVFGAAASGVLAVVVTSSGRWMLARLNPQRMDWHRTICFGAGLAAGMVLAFSDVMWSQAVIAEVYTLNALFLTLTLLCFFRWMADPRGEAWLLAGVFVFALGLTNHHTLLLLLPAFVLAVLVARAPELLNRTLLLVAILCAMLGLASGQALIGAVPLVIAGLWYARDTFFPSFLVGLAALCLSALAVLAWMSSDYGLQRVALVIGYAALLFIGAVSFAFVRKFDRQKMLVGFLSVGLTLLLFSLWLGHWFAISSAGALWMFLFAAIGGGLVATSRLNLRLIAGMLVLGWLGLLPYAYMPLASSTTPPMDWGYAEEGHGFYIAVNRGQYPNNLAATITSLADKAGLYENPSETPKPLLQRVQEVKNIGLAMKHYAVSLEENFTVPVLLFAFALVFIASRLGSGQRNWIYFLLLGFALLAFMMTLIEPPAALDTMTKWATRVFTLQSHCIFVLMIGYGLIVVGDLVSQRVTWLPHAAPVALVFLALLPLRENIGEANQAGHWFGYMYGHDMIAPLPRDAVLFGGTDPGRFVSTYMIFGESQRPDARDPEFDRRDVFIITQNSLADPYYLKYLNDQYDKDRRRREWNGFERWLGRPEQFPKTDILMPDGETMAEIYKEFIKLVGLEDDPSRNPLMGLPRVFVLNGLIARWIFENNKNEHTFFYEESLGIPWMRDHAVPDGLILRIEPEPVEELSDEIVAKDRAFWDRYTEALLNMPQFAHDPPAQRAFGKLRLSIGNVYRHHDMQHEALYAYRQASQLAPDSAEITFQLAEQLRDMDLMDESNVVLERAQALDPGSRLLPHMLAHNRSLRELENKEKRLSKKAAVQPMDLELHLEWLTILNQLSMHEKFDEVMKQVVQMPDLEHGELIESLQAMQRFGRFEHVAELLELREKIDPNNSEIIYNLAALYAFLDRHEEAVAKLEAALASGGEAVLIHARQDPRFHPMRDNKALKKILGQPWNGIPRRSPPAYIPIGPLRSLAPPEPVKPEPKDAPLMEPIN